MKTTKLTFGLLLAVFATTSLPSSAATFTDSSLIYFIQTSNITTVRLPGTTTVKNPASCSNATGSYILNEASNADLTKRMFVQLQSAFNNGLHVRLIIDEANCKYNVPIITGVRIE